MVKTRVYSNLDIFFFFLNREKKSEIKQPFTLFNLMFIILIISLNVIYSVIHNIGDEKYQIEIVFYFFR